MRRVVTIAAVLAAGLGSLAVVPAVGAPSERLANVERVSLASGGTQANGSSRSPSISPNGRFVAFLSDASTLAPGDEAGTDLFVRDRAVGNTRRVPRPRLPGYRSELSYVAAPAISDTGAVAFNVMMSSDASSPNASSRFVVWHHAPGSTSPVELAGGGHHGDSREPIISADGETVAYEWRGPNLDRWVPGAGVWVWRDGTSRLAAANDASRGVGYWPSDLSVDGQRVLVGAVFGPWGREWQIWDAATGFLTRVDVDDRGGPLNARLGALSGDGTKYVTAGNGTVWIHDIDERSSMERALPGPLGTPQFDEIEVDHDASRVLLKGILDHPRGRQYAGPRHHLVDLTTAEWWTMDVPAGGGNVSAESTSVPSLTGAGDEVVFASDSDRLVPRDTNRTSDVFVAGAPSSCGDAVVIGLRGSGDNATGGDHPGRHAQAVASELAWRGVRLRHDTDTNPHDGAIGVAYPAIDAYNPFYGASVNDGVAALDRAVAGVRHDCPGVPIVIAGYSQGAHVIQSWTDTLGGTTPGDVAAVIAFASPRFAPYHRASRGTFEADMDGGILGPDGFGPLDMRARAFCVDGDIVCQGRETSVFTTDAHTGGRYGAPTSDGEPASGEGPAIMADAVSFAHWAVIDAVGGRPEATNVGGDMYSIATGGGDNGHRLSAARMWGEGAPTSSFEWDLDGDNKVDRTTTGPTTHHEFGRQARSFTNPLLPARPVWAQVRARLVDGATTRWYQRCISRDYVGGGC